MRRAAHLARHLARLGGGARVGGGGRVFFCSLAGYALARLKFVGRGALFTRLLAVLAVPGIVLPMAKPALTP